LTLEEFRKVLPKQLLFWMFSQRSKDILAKSNLPYKKKRPDKMGNNFIVIVIVFA